jgi:hypothetical protein
MAAQTVNNETETKGGYTLAMVPFLDCANDRLDFSDGIETFLIMNNQLDWFDSHPKPSGGSQEKDWRRRHKYAICYKGSICWILTGSLTTGSAPKEWMIVSDSLSDVACSLSVAGQA